MRCGCPVCDLYMVHKETGAGCVCPNCLSVCFACTSAEQQPLQKDGLGLRLQTLREQYAADGDADNTRP